MIAKEKKEFQIVILQLLTVASITVISASIIIMILC